MPTNKRHYSKLMLFLTESHLTYSEVQKVLNAMRRNNLRKRDATGKMEIHSRMNLFTGSWTNLDMTIEFNSKVVLKVYFSDNRVDLFYL